MKLREDAGSSMLPPELEMLLLDGPAAIGKTDRELPPHEELRRAWLAHAAVLEGQRREPWFVTRDWWVRTCQGEFLWPPPTYRVGCPPDLTPRERYLAAQARAARPRSSSARRPPTMNSK